jgi:RNA ligase (TIGR02306 family)
MSEWHVEIVSIGPVEKHPNADTLSLTQIHGGYPVIFKTGEFKEGDLAVYIPVCSIVPDTQQFAFLQGKKLIKAKRLRGIFSQGMLLKITDELKLNAISAGIDLIIGTDVHELLNITKYDPNDRETEPKVSFRGQQEKNPIGWDFVKYTDIEGLRRYKNVIEIGEEVVITEKLHGSSGRFCYDGEKLWVGSRTVIRKDTEEDVWWKIAKKLNLEEKLKNHPFTIFFGEVYGKGVQDLNYNTDITFAIFDTYDIVNGRYNNWDRTVELANSIGLNTVPVLQKCPWKGFEAYEAIADGKSTIASHIREGFVVKPVIERNNLKLGRVIFKLVGKDYLLR